jgi:PKD repeat protein
MTKILPQLTHKSISKTIFDSKSSLFVLFKATWILLLFVASSVWAQQPPAAVRFVKNQGQWPTDIRYRADIPGGYLFLKAQSMVYVFVDTQTTARNHAMGSSSQARTTEFANAHAVEVAFEGSQIPQLEEIHKNTVSYNYFLGEDSSKWAANVPSFGEILYHDIYPGVDFKMYAFQQSLKYEFIVSPKADASKIKLKYNGSTGIKIIQNQLQIATSVNTFKELKPYTYQEIGTNTKEVATNFQLTNNTVTFDFPKGYDATRPLTIDPELVFSTYSGSFADNWGHTATYDDLGNLYTAGTVHDVRAFPATMGAFQIRLSGQVDIGVMKFNPDGSRLLYATFLGGSSTDIPHSLIVNNLGELVIFGATASLNFPTTTGAYQSRYGGGLITTPIDGFTLENGSDTFISKLNATGTQLVASTYLGGNGNDGVCRTTEFVIRNYGDEFRGEVVVDAKNDIYVATSTNSTNFPMVKAAINNLGGRQDAIVCKLSNDLRSLLYSTYLGGSGSDAAYGIKLAPSGAVYVSGVTRSANLPVKNGTFKNLMGGSEDGFVAKFANDQLEQITYLGTTAEDAAYLVDVDKDENVYVIGVTFGAYPVSASVYSNDNSGQFIQSLDKNLSKPNFSTVVGSGRRSPDISPTAFLVNDCGNIYFSGWGGVTNARNGYLATSSTNGLPVTADAFKKTTNGNNFYLSILEKGAKSLLYATYFGSESPTMASQDRGDHVDGGTSRFSKTGVVYHATCACLGTRFPSTPNAWSKTNNSDNCNNAAFKFDIDKLKASFDAYEGPKKDVTSGCAPLTLNFLNTSEGGKTYTWDVGGNTFSRDAMQANYTFNTPGEYRVTLRAFNPITCVGQDVAFKIIKVGTSKAKVSADTTVCSDVAVQLKAEGGIKYAWTPTAGLSNATIANPIVKVKTTTQFSVQVTDDVCTVTKTVTVKINNDKPDFNAFRDTTICAGRAAILQAAGSATRYRWSPALTLSDTVGLRVLAKPIVTTVYTVEGVYADGCRPTKTVTVKIDNTKPDFKISKDTTICEGQSARLFVQGGTSIRWSPLVDSTNRNPIVVPKQSTTYTVIANYPDGCQPRQTVTVNVERGPVGIDFALTAAYRCAAPTLVQFANKTPSADRYEWTFGNNTTSKTPTPAAFSYDKSGTYQVTLKAYSRAGCESMITKPVSITNLGNMPNVITPNADGKNDTFVVGIEGTKIEIYNRWGKRVFASDQYADEWGKGISYGVYSYLLTLPTGENCKGWIQVLE